MGRGAHAHARTHKVPRCLGRGGTRCAIAQEKKNISRQFRFFNLAHLSFASRNSNSEQQATSRGSNFCVCSMCITPKNIFIHKTILFIHFILTKLLKWHIISNVITPKIEVINLTPLKFIFK